MRRTRVIPNVTRRTKLRGAKRSPELAFRGTDFRVPKKLIFPSLYKKSTFCSQSGEIRKCWKDITNRFSICAAVDQEQGQYIRFCKKPNHWDYQWNICSIPMHKYKTQPSRYTDTRNASKVQSIKEPRIEDTVQVKDSSPRGTWRVGHVIKIIEGQGGKEGAAKVMLTNKNILQRSIIHL